MVLFRKHSRESVTKALVEAGADPDTATEIAGTLSDAGLSYAEAHAWLCHPERSHPVQAGELEIAGVVIPSRWTPIHAIEAGCQKEVLAEAKEFNAASSEEKAISRYFWSDIADARRLTGGDEARAEDIARIGPRGEAVLRRA